MIDAGFAVTLQLAEALDHFTHQGERQRIALRGPIQRDDSGRALEREGEMRIRHGVPPAFTPA